MIAVKLKSPRINQMNRLDFAVYYLYVAKSAVELVDVAYLLSSSCALSLLTHMTAINFLHWRPPFRTGTRCMSHSMIHPIYLFLLLYSGYPSLFQPSTLCEDEVFSLTTCFTLGIRTVANVGNNLNEEKRVLFSLLDNIMKGNLCWRCVV